MLPQLGTPTPLELPSDTQAMNKTTERDLKISIGSKAVLFLRVFLFAAAVPVLMRLKIARVAAILEPGREPHPVDPELITRILAYVETVIRRGGPLIRRGCLTHGLTRYYFLRRAGLDVSLRFGMGRVAAAKGFIGHCWLVREGEPYLEREDPRSLYVEMYCVCPENSRHAIGTGAIGVERLIEP